MTTQHIIVADADANTRQALVALITSIMPSAAVTACADGRDALRAFDAHGAVLVLTAYRMRRMNGITLIATLRARTAPPRIVMLSGYARIAQTAIAAGADAFLEKPVTHGQLAVCLSKVLGVIGDSVGGETGG